MTPDPLFGITNYDFSPDGKQLLISAAVMGNPSLFIAATDGTGIHELDLPGRVTDAAWRPPDGSEILFMDDGADSLGSDSSIYAFNVRDAKVRTILKGADAAGHLRGHPAWSPDGSLISYGEWVNSDALTVQTHIITANGTEIAPFRSRPTRCGNRPMAGRMTAPASSPFEAIPAVSSRPGPPWSPSTGAGRASSSRTPAA